MKTIPAFLVVSAVALTGCTVGESVPAPREAALLLRTGEGCARGCALDRPWLLGTEEVLDVVGVMESDHFGVRVEDPSIAAAWVQPVALCCGDALGSACHPMDASAACDATVDQRMRIVIRTLAVGQTVIEILDANGEPFAWESVTVEDAIEVSAIDAMVGIDDRRDIAGGRTDQAIDGRLRDLEIRAGQRARLQLVAIGPEGDHLIASEGIVARIDDPAIARLSEGVPLSCGTSAAADVVWVEGTTQGHTTLTLRAGGAQHAIALSVRAECSTFGTLVASADPCETDADCVPNDCCHATSCGSPSSAPVSCDGALCTLECRPGTLDCGGRCLCLQGVCSGYLPVQGDPSCATPMLPLPEAPF